MAARWIFVCAFGMTAACSGRQVEPDDDRDEIIARACEDFCETKIRCDFWDQGVEACVSGCTKSDRWERCFEPALANKKCVTALSCEDYSLVEEPIAVEGRPCEDEAINLGICVAETADDD